MVVGFHRTDTTLCQRNEVYRTRLAFDLTDFAPIHGVGKLLIAKATLSWTGRGEMNVGGRRSCVAQIGVVTADWGSTPGRFTPSEFYDGDNEGIGQSNVSFLVSSWMSDPVAARRGVVLSGHDESLDAGDSADCWTTIDQPQLELVYAVR